MNTEQQRADFEAWYMREFEVYPRRNESGGFKSQYVNAMFKSWKAGRAALQSQDAERLQAAARDMFVRASEIEVLYGTNKETEGLVKAAIRIAYLVGPSEQSIDHARRAEGDGEWMS